MNIRIALTDPSSPAETSPRIPMQAAIFDMDGVLIDSEPMWRRVEIAVFARLGVRLTEAMCAHTTGLRLDAAVRYWYQRFPWRGSDPVEVERELLAAVQGEIAAQGECMAGVEAALELCARSGLRIGLASSSPGALIDTVLERLGIAGYFACRCSAADEVHGKPDPAVYLSAARELGVVPVHCLAFEDSVPGIRAAKAAGMRVVALPDPARCDDPAFALADLRLDSLAALRPGHLLDLPGADGSRPVADRR